MITFRDTNLQKFFKILLTMVLQCMHMGLKISENYLLGGWWGGGVSEIFISVGGLYYWGRGLILLGGGGGRHVILK